MSVLFGAVEAFVLAAVVACVHALATGLLSL